MKEPIQESQPRPVRDLIETVFRHRKKALSFFLAVALSALAMLAFTPARYTSTAKLIVHRGRESVFVDPSAGGATLPLYKEWESEINTELEILNSREMVVQLVEALGPEAFFEEEPTDTTGRLGPVRKLLNPIRQGFRKLSKLISPDKVAQNESERQLKIDAAVQMVEKGLQIGVRPKSDIITVSYTGSRAALAQQVVTVLVDNYLERRIDLHQIPGGYQFFSQQTDLLRDALEENETRILEVKKKGGIDSISDNRASLQTAIEQLQTARLRVQAELASANARVSTIRSMLTQQSSKEVSSSNNTILDPLEYKKLQETLRTEDTSLAALIAQDQELGNQLDRVKKDLVGVEELETPIRRLQREHDLLEEKYRKYSENKEQARINQELETKKISNVTIVQHAALPEKPNPSGKLVKLAAALFLGFFGALAIAFGSDFIDPALYTADDVARRIKLNTLVELPRMRGKKLDPAYKPPQRHERRAHWILHSGKAIVPDGDSAFQDLYFQLIAKAPLDGRSPLVLGLTSSVGSEGVSTIAGRLAAVFSRDERFPRVLLLDANLTEHSSQLVNRRTDLPYDGHQLRVADDAGAHPVTASAVSEYLAQARQKSYDVILIDIPPLEEGNYSVRIAAETDLIALIVDCGRTPWRTVKRAAELLQNAGATLCGVILNRYQSAMPGWLYRRL